MTRATVNRICSALPGAEVSDPWGGGHDCWKVGGKMFAAIGSRDLGVSVKCADLETADMLREIGMGIKAPYLHATWILIPWGRVDEAELTHRLRTSYILIRSTLTRAARAALPPFP